MPTQYVTKTIYKKVCTKVCGCKPEYCTEYWKCHGYDNKQKHREVYNTKLSFYERIVEMNISMYCIMYFDEIMKKLSCYYFTLFSTL